MVKTLDLHVDPADHFIESYVQRTDEDELLEEAIGIKLSQWAKWDGLKLMRIFVAALEDSNFHSEAGFINDTMIPLLDDDNARDEFYHSHQGE